MSSLSMAGHLLGGPSAAAAAAPNDIYLEAATGNLIIRLASGTVLTLTPAGALVVPGSVVAGGVDLGAAVAALGSPVSNLLTNPGFEVWQRGPGPFALSGTGPDRWQLSIAGASTLSVTRDATNQDVGSQYCAACAYVQSAANVSRLLGTLGDQYQQLAGRTVSVSVRARVATPSAVRASVWDSVNGFRYGAYHSGGGAYETLSVTAPIAALATGVQVSVHLDASCTAYVDNATLVVGSVPLAYAPLTPADDLARCLRYYEVLGGETQFESLFPGQATVPTNAKAFWQFKVPKAIAPTVTVSAPTDFFVQTGAGNVAPTAVAFAQQTTRSVQLNITVAAGLVANDAVMICAANTAARLVAEANP